jgi:bilirubin oxidase
LLVPGARADVLVSADGDAAVAWQTLPYERGHETGFGAEAPLFELTPAGEPVEAPARPTSFAAIPELADPALSRSLVFSESTGGGPHAGHGGDGDMAPTFFFNSKAFPEGELFAGRLGDVEEWTLTNDTQMDHPFHLHGFRFQVVGENWEPPAFRAFYDTINVPAEQTVTLRVLLEGHAGDWMFHCHILEHAERGMMGTLAVAAP